MQKVHLSTPLDLLLLLRHRFHCTAPHFIAIKRWSRRCLRTIIIPADRTRTTAQMHTHANARTHASRISLSHSHIHYSAATAAAAAAHTSRAHMNNEYDVRIRERAREHSNRPITQLRRPRRPETVGQRLPRSVSVCVFARARALF